MIIQIGEWKVALGMEWVMPKGKAEVRAAKKARPKQASVFISAGNGDWLGFHSAGAGKVYSGALLIAMVEPNAVVYSPLNDEMGWICAISEGMPVVGYDEVLPVSEARAKAKDWSNLFANAEIIGDLSGARSTVQDVFTSLEGELASKSLSKKQLASAQLVNGSFSIKRALVMAGIVFGVGLAVLGVRTFQDAQARQERERVTLQEAARRNLAEKLNQERAEMQRKETLKELAGKAAAARAALSIRTGPRRLWDEMTRVRQSLPLSMYGYRPQSVECSPQSCKVEWFGAGRFTNPADKLRLPGVERSLTTDLRATSTFELSGVQDALPKASTANVEELAFLLQSKFGAKVSGFTTQPPQPVVVDGAQDGKQTPLVVGQVGKWHLSVQGGTALLQTGELMQMMARWPVRITSIKYQPVASTFDVDGEYVFVVE